MNQDQTHEELAAIRERLDEGDLRFSGIERAVAENIRITTESAEVLQEVRDALIFAKFGTRLIKWLGAIGAVAVTAVTLWTQWRNHK